MVKWAIYACMTATLMAWFFGCGYHFAGSGSFPAGVSRVFVTILENRSADSGAEITFTNDLVFEFTRNRPESLAQERSAADGILTGTIVSLSVENISRATVSTAVERRVTGIVNLRMESPDGRILWSSGNIVERETYDVVEGNKTATDLNLSAAIAAVSKKIAESAFNRLTDDF
jgi:hypothetical protein